MSDLLWVPGEAGPAWALFSESDETLVRDLPAQKELESARAAWLSSVGARHGAEVSDAGTFIVPAASLQVSRFIPTSFSVIFFNSVLSSFSLPCVIVSLELVQSKKTRILRRGLVGIF